ncbi:hypothetical protein [Actinotignum sp. GS-2025c]|uniref:hypothetical protein n=1 Tax=Actinotignum sp. GS-2025c TaxID=3427276 RepID=UPI003F45898C
MDESPLPTISKSAATSAGRVLAKLYTEHPEDAEARCQEDQISANALATVQNWRSQHLEPTLNAFAVARDTITDIPGTLVTFRLKRISSIVAKLSRSKNDFRLGAMDDIGGCRIITNSCDDVFNIATALSKKMDLKPENGVKDYIRTPQRSGYRSYHLITLTPPTPTGYRVEIQVRTFLQHAWATALEAAGSMYERNYKNPAIAATMDESEKTNRRFFQIVSALFALSESQPVPPGMPSDKNELLAELRASEKYRVLFHDLANSSTSSYQNFIPAPSAGGEGTSLYVLEYDQEAQSLRAEPFPHSALADAVRAYNDREENDVFGQTRDTVLVHAQTPENLALAFPNYTANLDVFNRRIAPYFGEN